MTRVLLILLPVTLLLSGCFIADEIFMPPEPEKEKSLQEKCETSVSKHLKKEAGNLKYTPYGFSKIFIYKPVEILELEKLVESYKSEPNPATDSIIKAKRAFIEEKGIERTVELDHFYTLSDSLGNITVLEEKFRLNDTLGVIDATPLIILEIPEEYEDVLVYYFYEYTIFLGYSYDSGKRLSQEFYGYFKSHLEELKTISARSGFLWHTLKLVKKVKEAGEFNQQAVLEDMTKTHIRENRPDIENYQPLDFSTLYQNSTEDSKSVINYYFFHKFIGLYGKVLDTNVVMVEFTPYYEIDQIYQMDRPFEPYFK